MRQFFKRMRSPRYLLALVFGGLYFFTVFGGPSMLKHRALSPRESVEAMLPMTHLVGPVLLALLAALWWLMGTGMSGLALKPAETNLLVPAPITRRRLIEYKLLSGQPGILSSAIMMCVMMRSSLMIWPLRLPSMWMMLSILQMHQIGAALVHTSLQSHGKAAWRRVWPATIVFAGILSVVVITLVRTGLAVSRTQPGNIMKAVTAVFDGTAARIALAPFNTVLAPLNAPDFATWVMPFGICALVLVLHYIWVVRMDAAFEETAAVSGARHAAALEAMRAGKRIQSKTPKKLKAPWFRIEPMGAPEYGIWWKNVLSFTRNLSPYGWLGIAVFTIAAVAIVQPFHDNSIRSSFLLSGGIILGIGVVGGVMGPLAVRIDLRTDLRRIELLRTLPVGGTRFVAAQIGASAFALALVELIPIVGGGVLMLASGKVDHIGLWIGLAVPAILLLLAYNGIQLVIQNGFALFFPAWARIGGTAPGIETLGQNIITMIGSVLLLIVAFIPPILAGAATGASMFSQWGQYAAIPGGIAFLATLYAEVFFALIWLGNAYDRIDPVEAGLCT